MIATVEQRSLQKILEKTHTYPRKPKLVPTITLNVVRHVNTPIGSEDLPALEHFWSSERESLGILPPYI